MSQTPGGLTENQQINNAIMYTKKNAVAISDADRRVWELLTDVPKLHVIPAWACCIANFFVSGLGTIISAFLDPGHINKTQIFAGLCMLLTSVYLVGWILSLYWGYMIVMKSGKTEENKKLITPGQLNSSQPNNPYAVLDE